MGRRIKCVVRLANGMARPAGHAGLWFGRAGDCDIVLSDPNASRRHALVRCDGHGAELVALGRNPTLHNGQPVTQSIALADNDRLELPGLVVTISLTVQHDEESDDWVLRRVRDGSAFGISRSETRIGGEATDDVVVPDLPPQAFMLYRAQNSVAIEARIDGISLADAALPIGAVTTWTLGAVLRAGDEQFELVAHHADHATAVTGDALPLKVELELLPRGGRCTFTLATGVRAVYFAEKRFDLMSCLAAPEHGRCGDFIDDEVLMQRIWPRNAATTRLDLNTLISRCRKDLLRAGLDGPQLIQRSPGGGATRLALRAT